MTQLQSQTMQKEIINIRNNTKLRHFRKNLAKFTKAKDCKLTQYVKTLNLGARGLGLQIILIQTKFRRR